jgi:feruloyl esterase
MTNLSRRWWHRPAAVAAVVMIGTGIVRTNERHPSAPAAAQAPPHSETPPPPLFSNAAPVRSCESLREVSLANVTIDAATTDEATGACRVTATVTHPPAQDAVKIWIALPAKNWNGRFQGVGGGGFSGGSENGVRAPLDLGYAAGSTDTGHTGGSGSFALDANNRLNWMLIRDNAYLGIHEMTVVGKALVEAFYGKAPPYSYFNGCSTGGRQGLMEAQRYPADYNGILSGAPAINWTKLHPEQLWGHLVMLEAHDVLPMCKLNAAAAAAIAECDPIDGVNDGVIDDPKRCAYDPKALVGTVTGDCGAFTETDAEVIRKIWEGPRRRDGSFLWYGLQRGAPLH